MKRKKVMSVVLVLIMMLLLIEIPVYSATAGVSDFLKSNKVYKNYDLNGDGKKDKIVLKERIQDKYKLTAYFIINGKKVYTLANKSTIYRSASYQIITLQNGKSFIVAALEGHNTGISSSQILSYKNNKIKKEKDIKNMMKNFQGASFIENYPEKGIQVKGNEVIIRYTSMNWTTGYRVYVFTFKYKDGGLKRNYDGDLKYLDKCYHAKKDIKIYEKPESSRVAYTLKMGEGSYIEKYYLKNDKLYLQVRDMRGRIGWIRALTYAQTKGLSGSPLFAEGGYAS